MAKESDRPRRSLDLGETGGALSGLLADDEELDRGALWRLGSWGFVAVGAVIVALMINQSSIGARREQYASADLLKQAQQLQLAAKESQNEARRLASAVDTLSGDRDRLYSRVAVLEQGLDSVTGTIGPRSPVSSAAPAGSSQAGSQATPGQSGSGQASANQGSMSPANTSQAGVSQGNANGPSSNGASLPSTSASLLSAGPSASSAPAAPTATATVEPQTPAAKSSPAPAIAAVAATAPAVVDKAAATDKAADKQDKQVLPTVSSETTASVKPVAQQTTGSQSLASPVTSKSTMAPPDPAGGNLIEPAASSKVVTAAPLPEIAAVTSKAADEMETAAPAPIAELVATRTEFGVDVGGANSIQGLRALWRGLIRARSNTALAKLRPVIVIKENTNGLGMQLRLVAGPISDAAAAAKICASLTLSDRGCTTSVFEGQRLALGADDVAKPEASKLEPAEKPAPATSRVSSRRHVSVPKRANPEEAPKQESSTLSQMFSRR